MNIERELEVELNLLAEMFQMTDANVSPKGCTDVLVNTGDEVKEIPSTMCFFTHKCYVT